MKKLIKNIIIFLFGRVKNLKKSRCLFYHDIHTDNQYTYMSTDVKSFESHIRTIRDSGFELVKKITKDNGQITISFDDGFAGIYDNIELINKLEVPVTIFIITSLIGSKNYLSKEQIIKLNNNPLINFQSHTHTHPDLPFLSNKILEFELLESKRILENICNKTIDSVCYPRGLFSSLVIKMANRIGYKEQYSSLPGVYISSLNIRRRNLVQFSSNAQLKDILKGGSDLLFGWYYNKHYIR